MEADTAPKAAQAPKIDWIDKLRHLLQTLAFCLAIAAIQYAVQPERPYELPLVYSLAIGSLTWACIDFGRHLFPSNAATGWPAGIPGIALPACGMVLGYLGGTALADAWFGWSSWDGSGLAQLRVSVVITLLAGLAGTYFFYTRGHSATLRAQVSEVRTQATEARLKLLEAQLEPHMMFNTLANLRVLIATDPPRAQAMLDHLIAYLRATLGRAWPLPSIFPKRCGGCPCPRCCCSPWWKTPSDMGWSRRWQAATSVCTPAPGSAPTGPCWCWKWWIPAWAWRSHQRTTRTTPEATLAWRRCASAWPPCTAHKELLN